MTSETGIANGEVDTLVASIFGVLDRVVEQLDGLSAQQLNFRPPIAGANSAYVIATHTLGNARAWVLGIACGQVVRRDRPAEFRATASDASRVRDELASFRQEKADPVAALDGAALERRLLPPQELWGEGTPREINVRYAFLHVIEHASLHLGHIHMTRDLALAAG